MILSVNPVCGLKPPARRREGSRPSSQVVPSGVRPQGQVPGALCGRSPSRLEVGDTGAGPTRVRGPTPGRVSAGAGGALGDGRIHETAHGGHGGAAPPWDAMVLRVEVPRSSQPSAVPVVPTPGQHRLGVLFHAGSQSRRTGPVGGCAPGWRGRRTSLITAVLSGMHFFSCCNPGRVPM